MLFVCPDCLISVENDAGEVPCPQCSAPLQPAAAAVLGILTRKKGSLLAKCEEVRRLVTTGLTGAFLYAANGEVYYRDGGRIFALDSPEMLDILQGRFALNPSTNPFKYVVAYLPTLARTSSGRVQVHQVAHYDEKRGLYLSTFDGGVLRVDGTHPPARLRNGDDGVLFMDNPHWAPYRPAETYVPGELERLVVDGINFVDQPDGLMTATDQRRLFFVYVLTLPYGGSVVRTIVFLCGDHGSGKTQAARTVNKMYFGPAGDVAGVSVHERDVIAAVSGSFLVVFDNEDVGSPELADWLCRFSTGSLVMQRRLFTTNSLLETRPNCWVAITTRNNPHRRPDLMDRALLFT